MEIHISTDDRNFATNICKDIEDRLIELRGYASISGYNIKNEYEYKVFHGKDDITDKFPKRITFGEMLNMMRQSNAQSLYFQREDWRGTHNFLSMNQSNGANLYIEYLHEDSRQPNQYFDEDGVPLADSIPYIPTYDDMFVHNWILCDFSERANYEKKETNICDSTL